MTTLRQHLYGAVIAVHAVAAAFFIVSEIVVLLAMCLLAELFLMLLGEP